MADGWKITENGQKDQVAHKYEPADQQLGPCSGDVEDLLRRHAASSHAAETMHAEDGLDLGDDFVLRNHGFFLNELINFFQKIKEIYLEISLELLVSSGGVL